MMSGGELSYSELIELLEPGTEAYIRQTLDEEGSCLYILEDESCLHIWQGFLRGLSCRYSLQRVENRIEINIRPFDSLITIIPAGGEEADITW